MAYKIFNPKEDIQGNQKENVFIVMNEEGYIGNGYVYPKITPITPDHPLNIFIEMNLETDILNSKVGHDLFLKLKNRAKDLAKPTALQALLYYGSEAINDKTHFFNEQGFDVKLNTLKLTRETTPFIRKVITYEVITYEVMTSKDLQEEDELVKLHNRVLLKPITNDIIHELSHKEHFNCFRVYDKGKLIASMILYKKDNHGFIDHIVVDKSYKRKGIGSYLIGEAIDYFVKHFMMNISLEVWSANKGALKFYEQLGFKEEAATEYYIGTFLV